MSWPTAAEVADALRHPLRCFSDGELRRARPAFTTDGTPRRVGGSLADVFEIRDTGGFNRWAVKFYRQHTPGLDLHYRDLADHLLRMDVPWLAPFQHQERGVCVRGRWFPALKMRWREGVPLHAFVEEHADRPDVLRRLVGHWLQLSQELRKVGLAHGLLQHEHVLVAGAPGGDFHLRLIDYDAMFLQARAGAEPPEVGHPAYEHPRRAWQRIYDDKIDRFPQLVVYASLLLTAACGRGLWQRFHDGNNLLFREFDFQDPGSSVLFRELWGSPLPPVRALVARVLLAAQGEPGDVPLINDLEAQAGTRLATDACDLPKLHLTAEEREQVEATLADHAGAAGARKTFGILIESGTSLQADDDFSLTVDDEPESQTAAAQPPPLPDASDPPPLPCAEGAPVCPPCDPRAGVYRLQAWMPEQVAVMKVKGFVDSWRGEVVASEPGLMRVQVPDPHDLMNPRKPGMLSWMGFTPGEPPGPRSLAVLEFHMQHSETDHQKLLDITLHVLPADGSPEGSLWRPFCDRLFCDARGFLMGNR